MTRALGARSVWLASAGFAVLYAVLGIDRYATYHATMDLGTFAQAIGDARGGLRDLPENGSHFARHFSPILYVCVPVLALARSAAALQVVQAVAGALAAPALYLFARRRMPPRLAAGVAVVALVYPPLASVTFVDFHENGFATAATLWLAWAIDARRFTLAFALLALTLSIKEDQALIVGFGAVVTCAAALRRHDRVLAAGACAGALLCATAFVLYFAVVQPLAGAHRGWTPLAFYTQAGTYGGAVVPFTSFARFGYLLEALGPLLFVPLRSRLVVFAFPGFAEDLLSRHGLTFTMGSHYPAVWLPYVLLAFADGVAIVAGTNGARAGTLVRAAALVSSVVLVAASPAHWRLNLALRDAHDAALDRAIARLPAGLEVGTQDEIFAHIGRDPHASLGVEHAPPYLLLDRERPSYWYVKTVPALAARGARAYRGCWTDDGITLYARATAGCP